jgi:hypothetical protein
MESKDVGTVLRRGQEDYGEDTHLAMTAIRCDESESNSFTDFPSFNPTPYFDYFANSFVTTL